MVDGSRSYRPPFTVHRRPSTAVRGALSLPRSPAELLHVHRAAHQGDPFGFEKLALPAAVLGEGALGDPAVGGEDAVPGEARLGGKVVERVADEARVARKAGEARDLAVARHAAARDAADDGVDALV